MSERDVMEFDVVIVGAGPAGLSAACRIMQLSQKEDKEVTVCVVEKGSEVGAHILSGAILETRALDELFPDWKTQGAPLNTPVDKDELYLLSSDKKSTSIPSALIPKTMHNKGNYIVSLGNVCRWLAEQAEGLGVEIYPGFSASEILYNEEGSVRGIRTGDMGVAENGEPKDGYMQGMDLVAKYTVFSEGCRGNLGKELIERFDLNKDAEPQHYALGFKELWDIPSEKHQEGLVIHGSGWPLNRKAGGGFFLYHAENNQVVVGLIVDLNYSDPYLSPFDEFQRMKQHPLFAQYLEGGKRVSYGARAIAKGGINALPKMSFAGGFIAGCDAGTLNFAKIKGSHTAMKSGMLVAEEIFSAIESGVEVGKELTDFGSHFKQSWLYEELQQSRNFGPALHKYGTLLGGTFNFIDQNIFNGKLPFTLSDKGEDYAQMQAAKDHQPIDYPKPDGQLSFDKLSSVFLSNTNHEENQLCHLLLADKNIPIDINLRDFAEPAQRYCPAGVYEIIEENNQSQLQINAQNCVHCKTCDIKDPSQNITWVTPEGGGGPNYPNM